MFSSNICSSVTKYFYLLGGVFYRLPKLRNRRLPYVCNCACVVQSGSSRRLQPDDIVIVLTSKTWKHTRFPQSNTHLPRATAQEDSKLPGHGPNGNTLSMFFVLLFFVLHSKCYFVTLSHWLKISLAMVDRITLAKFLPPHICFHKFQILLRRVK